MSFYWLALGTLAVWRITHLLQAEDGPWHIVVRLRGAAGASSLGRLLDCFYCLSLWISAPFAYLIGATVVEQIVLWPALSGGAIVLERLSDRESAAQPAAYFEDTEEDQHDVLRR